MDRNNIYKFKPFLFENTVFNGDKKVPKARSGHRIVATDSYVYAFGGYCPIPTVPGLPDPDYEHWDEPERDEGVAEVVDTKPLFRQLWRYSLTTRRWERLETTGRSPEEVASHSVALIGGASGYLLSYGGTDYPFGLRSSNRLFACNLKTKDWTCVKESADSRGTGDDVPPQLYGQAMTVDPSERYVYVMGGTNGFEYTIDVFRYDMACRVWEQLFHKPIETLGTFPEERYRHEMVLYEERRLFVFGGGTAHVCHSMKVIPIFDVELRQWSSVDASPDESAINRLCDGYPEPRRCHDLIRIEEQVFIMGGTNGHKLFDDFWRFDLTCSRWTRIGLRLPKAVCFHSASVAPNGRMALFGGVTNINHKERTNTMSTVWLGIPKLKEMAFDAISHYVRQQIGGAAEDDETDGQSTMDALRELRIPLTFTQRM